MEFNDNTVHPTKTDHLLTVIFQFVVILVSLPLLAFLWVPPLVKYIINRKIEAMPNMAGHIDAVLFNIFSTTIIIRGFSMINHKKQIEYPFITIREIRVKIEICHRKVRFKADVYTPELNLVKGETDNDSQMNADDSWLQLVAGLMKSNINRVEVFEGKFHFYMPKTEPPVHIEVSDIHLTLKDLNIKPTPTDPLPSDLELEASAYGGTLRVVGNINHKSATPLFDLKGEAKDIGLIGLNPLLLAFANIDVSQGTFALTAEIAAKDQRLAGYIKPFVHDLKIFDWKEDKKSSLKKIAKELFLQTMVAILKNNKEDQLATRIVIDGPIDGPGIKIWNVIGCLLFNAFVESISPLAENSISIDSVGNMEHKRCGQKSG